MAEININITVLGEQIVRLSLLKDTMGLSGEALPEISGKGPVASGTRTLGEKLMGIRENLETLFDGTRVFLNDAGNSFLTTDTKLRAGYEE